MSDQAAPASAGAVAVSGAECRGHSDQSLLKEFGQFFPGIETMLEILTSIHL
ncbi:hypothetical protein [Microvirga sp. P5_D2]